MKVKVEILANPGCKKCAAAQGELRPPGLLINPNGGASDATVKSSSTVIRRISGGGFSRR